MFLLCCYFHSTIYEKAFASFYLNDLMVQSYLLPGSSRSFFYHLSWNVENQVLSRILLHYVVSYYTVCVLSRDIKNFLLIHHLSAI
jgi:hypothetical protein